MLLPGSERIFSRSRIRTPLGKWDSPKSPQGYCRAVADPDFQIRGGGGRSQMQFFCGPQFGLNITGAPPWIRHWLGKKTVFRKKMTEVRDTGLSWKRGGNAGWGHVPTSLLTLRYFPCFISSTLANESNISFTHINDNKNNKFYIEIQLISSYLKHPQTGYKLI